MAGPYSTLLGVWCDALVAHQVTEIGTRGIYGGIVCPVCARVHGRSAEAVYPLMYRAHTTNDTRYLDSAVRVQAWSDLVSYPDGSWANEPIGGSWRGITVFGAVALAEALRHHGGILDRTTWQRWIDRLARAAAYLYDSVDMSTGVINYPITCSAAMALTGEVLDEPRYTARARDLAHGALAYFTEPNKLLFGEGIPQNGVSPLGCRPVDLGYNVEESLPALVVYGKVLGDEEVLEVVAQSLRAHLEFMLPDGAWDNSWGTRNFKWTYWGSRTAAGCQSAYALLADRDPVFAEAALRNLGLLAACTHDGLLTGGPHYRQHGELPCIHHTFCHAKALATTLDYGFDELTERPYVALPREAPTALRDHVELGVWLAADGPWRIREFPEIRTWLVAVGMWRATVTGYDWVYQRQSTPSGGALAMLWHQDVGALLAASMTEYWMVEPSNMQPHRDALPCVPLTPRFELEYDGTLYRNLHHGNAAIQCSQDGHGVTFIIHGKLVDAEGAHPGPGEVSVMLNYRFSDLDVTLAASLDHDAAVAQADLIVPVVSMNNEPVRQEDRRTFEIAKPGGRVRLSTNAPNGFEPWDGRRMFHHVPGFEAVPFKVKVNRQDPAPIHIEIGVR